MIDEFKRSINAVLYERATSPFFGTLFISWIICNWQIVTVLFFDDEKILKINKITYIENNFSNLNTLVYFPLGSTIILLTLVPFITNGAFWLSLKFQKWRYDKKNTVENLKLLTLEKSIQLREEIQKQQEKFEKLLQARNLEIELLTKQNQSKNKLPRDDEDDNLKPKFLEILFEENRLIEFEKIVKRLQNNESLFFGSDSPSSDFISYLEAEGFLDNSTGMYKFTPLGKDLLKTYSIQKLK